MPPRRDIPAFPFAPYPIQSEFMYFLYAALSSGPRALALLESPTGTGKTLSIVCSALQWLLDQRDAAARGHPDRANGSAAAAGDGDDDEPNWMRDFTPPRKIAGSEKSEGFEEDEEEFLLEEYESDGEDGTRREAGKRAHCGSSSESEEDGEEELEEVTPKVYFTSCTQSQVAALAVCRGAQEDGVRAFAGRPDS